MCLHGFSGSGQVHSARNAAYDFGNSATPVAVNKSSSSGGMSPSSSRATKPTFAAMASVIRSHCAAVGAGSPAITWYGRDREPCTRAARRPDATSTLRT
jgi:hypothetical protein